MGSADAAVQIVAEVMRENAPPVDSVPADVVAALARAGLLHDPAELDAARGRVAELAEAIGELFILDVGRSTQGRAWVKVDQEGFDRLRAALKKLDASTEKSGGVA